MSGRNIESGDNTPVAVTVTRYPQYTAEYDNYATPVVVTGLPNHDSSPYAVTAQPYNPSIPPRNTSTAIIVTRHNLQDDVFYPTISLSRSMRCLACVDIIVLLLLSLFSVFWLVFIWGPICGYFGASKYKLNLMYIYAVYWGLRLLIDVILASLGLWWNIISLIVDLFIMRYVWAFAKRLKQHTPEELYRLKHPFETQAGLATPIAAA